MSFFFTILVWNFLREWSIALMTSVNSASTDLDLLGLILQELQVRSGKEAVQMDHLSFMKFTDLPGLSGLRLFQAMDSDHDHYLTEHDLVSTLRSLYLPSPSTAQLLFSLLDFTSKGYLLPIDFQALFTSLPLSCPYCHTPFNSKSMQKVDSIINTITEIDRGKMEIAVEKREEVVEMIRNRLIWGLPRVFDCVFGYVNTACDCLPAQALNFPSLTVDSTAYTASFSHNALWLYSSPASTSPTRVIPLNGLFSQASDSNICLCDGNYIVNFTNFDLKFTKKVIKTVDFRVKYRLEEEIGSGSSGKVYKSTNLLTNTLFAVKIIPKTGLSRRIETLIRQEIAILSHFHHSTLLKFEEFYENNDEIVIITEYMNEGSLFDWLERRNFSVNEEESKEIVRNISLGLVFLHKNWVVHRDIKPENVLIRRENGIIEAKIADLGLSCYLGPEETCAEAVGTLKYAAPEVISRLPYGETVDWWSLGVTVHVLLRGIMPFAGKTDEETALAVLRRRVNYQSKRWSEVSAAAVSVVSRLLVRNPRMRIGGKEVLESDWLRRGT